MYIAVIRTKSRNYALQSKAISCGRERLFVIIHIPRGVSCWLVSIIPRFIRMDIPFKKKSMETGYKRENYWKLRIGGLYAKDKKE